MASMGSFPTGVDSSILARSGNRYRPVIPLLAFRQRNSVEIGNFSDCNSARISRDLTEDLLSRLSPCCGCSTGRWRVKRVAATREGGVVGEAAGDEADDALQATINKSKKVLAMQRDLLEQIAERKKLVSSIKNSIMEQEVSDQSFVKVNGSASSRDAASAEEATNYRPAKDSSVDEKPQAKQPEKNISSLGVQPKDVPAKAVSSLGVQPKSVPAVPWNSAVIANAEPSSNKGLAKEAKSTADTVPGPVPAGKVQPSEMFKDSSVNKPSLSEMTPSANNEKQKDLKESIPVNGNAEVLESNDEDAKPPPLAGVNVMNVILVAAECAPWSKTGGLGDVAGALPKALARRGHRVMVIAPRYGEYADVQDSGVMKRYKVDGQDLEVKYFQTFVDGVDFVFIDSPVFRHIGNDIYGGKREDILKRMVLFCKAAIEVPWYVPCGGICYGDGNLVFIANDWHTALLPVYLKAYYRDNGLMEYTRSVLVIHNVAHQGRGPVADFPIVDLPPHYLDLFKFYDPVGGEHLNIFAAGLKMADRIVTVSHGYSWELKTQEGGWGLHGIINECDWKFRGIVNGIDTKDWTPELDVYLQSDGYVNYSFQTIKTGKAQCKAALQKELGLPVRDDVPLIGFIGRLDYQKGVDLIAEAVPWMMSQDVQLVMLGTGRLDLEDLLRRFEGEYKDKVRGWVGFSVKTAHRITAGADILLMPSRFEPCGLNQLYAMRYGTIPVVHAVGGLRDTVHQFNPFEETGLGWTFSRADSNELIHALGNCLWTYREYKQSWEGLQRRGMEQDLSWDNVAQNYEEVLVAAKYQW